MIYRLDDFSENKINPITGREYDDSWIILMLADNQDHQLICGGRNGCAYTVKISRDRYENWKTAVCDFIGFHQANGKNIILVISEKDLKFARNAYSGHRYDDRGLRDDEPSVLIHSTSMENWTKIRRDGSLKSWNALKAESAIPEEFPIGRSLGDPPDFSDYIMLGGGIAGEIVVNSKQQGKIVMDENAEYVSGARLYFDAEKLARDGLLIRDGCHSKVKDELPLDPYLIWAATWENAGLKNQITTPKRFAEQADACFQNFLRKNRK